MITRIIAISYAIDIILVLMQTFDDLIRFMAAS